MPNVRRMSRWSCNVGATRHAFSSLRELMAKATPLRSGDILAGVAVTSAEERVAAQLCLADVPLTLFLDDLLVPYEADEVTRLIIDTVSSRMGMNDQSEPES